MVLILSFFSACNKENQLPTCAITYPENEDEFEKGDTIAISVEANDNDGLIAEVNFYIDDIGVFSSSTFPYKYDWNTSDETIGDHIIKVIAKDNEGGSKTDECTISLIGNATIVTTEASSITHNSAKSGGNITNDGGTSILERGVCWNTLGNPTLSNDYTTDGSGFGSFTSTVTGLIQNTTYHVRAYATNIVGTAYGSEVTFTTPTTPTLTTTAISAITDNSAQSGGNITNDGGATVTARGVCWSTSWSPTIADSKTIDDSGTGSFISTLTSLSFGTTYYVRAYATNSVGTAYGSEKTFITHETGNFTDTRDSHEYKWIKIGEQVWMSENLAYLPSVSPSSSGSNTNPLYYVYGYQGSSVSEAKATSNYITYGVLYNWPAAMAGELSSSSNPSDVQGVCPDDWHLPSHVEWKELIDFLGGGEVAGGKLKEFGTTHWSSPNEGATNESGFTALPGGNRYWYNGLFNYIGLKGTWWSSTNFSSSGDSAWARWLSSDRGYVSDGDAKAEYGISVRCIRDD